MQSSGIPILLAPRFPAVPTPVTEVGALAPTRQAEIANLPAQPAPQFGAQGGQFSVHGSGIALATPEMFPSGEMTGSPATPPVNADLATETPAATPTAPPPTATAYMTPTPTASATPTITPTPLPPPPWLSTRLPATDPRTVVLNSGRPQLILFFAYWSGPSQAMAPIVQGLEAEFGNRVAFTYLDIDDPATEALKDRLGFKMEPHFFLLDGDGRTLRQWTGSLTLEELRQALTQAVTP